MFGLSEPRLDALEPPRGDWLAGITGQISPARLRADVEAMPAPRNRLHAPEAMARADAQILDSWRAAGWRTEHRAYELRRVVGCRDYADESFLAGARPAIYAHLSGANLLACKEGATPGEAIVIGAHHDTLRDSPGADDNTASVAALLELARILAPCRFDRSVILAALDMEEIGFFGTRALLAELPASMRIRGAIIYETMAFTAAGPNTQLIPDRLGWLFPAQIGKIRRRQLSGDWTLVVHRRSSRGLATSFARGLAHIAGPHAPILMRDPAELPVVGGALRRAVPALASFGRSDHSCFWAAGIPAMMVTDTAEFRNPHYHQPTDVVGTLDFDRLAAIVGATAFAVAEVATLLEP